MVPFHKRSSLPWPGLVFAALFASVTPFAPSQTTTPPLVKLRITVTDTSGNPVKTLRQEDFIVSEGDKQEIKFFSKREVPISYGLLVDNTGSMKEQTDEAIRIASAIVNTQDPADEAFLARLINGQGTIAVNWTPDKTHLLAGLASFKEATGRIALNEALRWGGDYFGTSTKTEPSDQRTRALILISDGVETQANRMKTREVVEALRGNGIQIFAISLYKAYKTGWVFGNLEHQTRRNSEEFMNTIAEATGGRAYFLGAKKDRSIEAAKSILDVGRFQYVIGYTPKAGPNKRGERKVRVKLLDAADRDKYSITTTVIE